MVLRLNTALRDVIVDALAAPFSGGTLQIYTGLQLSSTEADPVGVLLATIDLPEPAFDASVDGIATLTGAWTTVTVAGGRANWARFTDASDTLRMDVGINELELSLDFTEIIEGETLTVQSFTITHEGSEVGLPPSTGGEGEPGGG